MVHYRNRGYTLIELIVTMAVISIVASVTFALNTSESRQIARLDAAARNVESVISYIQAIGIGGRAYPPGTTNFDTGYGVYVTTQGSGQVITYGGSGEDTPPDGVYERNEAVRQNASYNVEQISLPGAVSVRQIQEIDWTGAPQDEINRVDIFFVRGVQGALIYKNDPTALSGVRIELGVGAQHRRYVCVFANGLIYDSATGCTSS